MEKGLIEEVKLRIGRSRGALRSAETLLNEKEYGDSISRSYYTMFHMAKALVLCEGKDAKTHKGLLSIFGQEFVKTGEIEKYVGNLIKELQEARVRSDYEYEFIPLEQDARKALNDAKEFTKILEEYIAEHYKIVLEKRNGDEI